MLLRLRQLRKRMAFFEGIFVEKLLFATGVIAGIVAVVGIVGVLGVNSSYAQKVNFEVGVFSLNAQIMGNLGGSSTGNGSGSTKDFSLLSLGSYSLSANFFLTSFLEISPGYTIFLSRTYQGDMGFGPDFTLFYFPFGSGSALNEALDSFHYWEIDKWRPFLGLAFHQRQFQSTQSSFSGFGGSLGVEYQLEKRKALRAIWRHMVLVGPSSLTFRYSDVLIGIQYHF